MASKATEVYDNLSQRLKDTVRESGYNAAMLASTGNIGTDYSRAVNLYEMACSTLRAWAKYRGSLQDAERYIAATWEPIDGGLATLRDEYERSHE